MVTEDSDLLAYGCPRVLFKLDRKSGRVSTRRSSPDGGD